MTTTTSRATSSATSRMGSGTAGGCAAGLFVITEHKVRDRSPGGAHDWVPYGAQHAWRPGERRALCGEWTAGWTVFWERPFSARRPSACPGCVEATLPEASRRRLDSFERAS